MAETRTAATHEPVATVNNDLVPTQWRNLFTNEEWLIHRIIVLSTYGFLAIAVVAHILVWLWRPWIQF